MNALAGVEPVRAGLGQEAAGTSDPLVVRLESTGGDWPQERVVGEGLDDVGAAPSAEPQDG
ncbi:hypothetical protein [Streptomyces sp. NPDC001380]|uniref:hypothetical protein n=1 Tax=Streptomyces sp. NPDC001380 TaxID=3364566 RepID=UPI0036935269